MRPISIIYTELRREQAKLNMMPLTDRAAIQKQSEVVDDLVVEYYRGLLEQEVNKYAS